MDKYAIYVVEKLAELREVKINEILDEEYKPNITNKSNFIGFTDNIRFINWYDNRDYVKLWNTEKEAQDFLNWLLEKAEKNYQTWKDPFRAVLNTKGDWKSFKFIVTKVDFTNDNNCSNIINT